MKSKSTDFILKRIKPTKNQEVILYNLLKNREFNISHKKMPTAVEHAQFVKNHPYRGWWIILDSKNTSNIIGSVYVNNDNSIGLNISLKKISFSASFFTKKLKRLIKPLESKPSIVYFDFFYNVPPQHRGLIKWLTKSGYYKSQISFSPR